MLTNPIWVVKTRMFSTSVNDPAAYRGLLRAFNLPSQAPRLPKAD
jgi:hypothetical protein